MAIGTVKFWNARTGVGWITAADYRDVFVHHSQLRGDIEPRKGDRVEYVEAIDKRGRLYARDVKKIDCAGAVVVDVKPAGE